MTEGADSVRFSQRLFAEFPPVPTEAWEAQIREDLGEMPYEDQLLWKQEEDLVMRPYYRAEDLRKLAHVDASEPSRAALLRRDWCIQQNIRIREPAPAACLIRRVVEGGVDRLGLDLTAAVGQGAPSSTGEVRRLLDGIDLETTGLHVEAGMASLGWLDELLHPARRAGTPPAQATASFDPLSEAALTGLFVSDWLDLAARAVQEYPPKSARILRAGADVYHEAGASLVESTGLLLSTVSEYLAQLTLRGRNADQIVDRLYVALPIDRSYFLEIARLRALRLLLPQVVAAYGYDGDDPSLPIHATTSRRSMTRYDPHTNLLRSATEAASAVIGGCDVLVVRPFDAIDGEPSETAYRLARNLQLLLRHEAHLDKVADPAAGSYYVEVLTDKLARAIWRTFQRVEERGGLLHALRSGYVQEMVGRSLRGMWSGAATCEHVLVGTNRFPDRDERLLQAGEDGRDREAGTRQADPLRRAAELTSSTGGRWQASAGGDRLAGALPPHRAAEELERMRLRTERYAAQTGRRPLVAILPAGDAAAGTPRVQFAADFMGCAGFDVRVASPASATDDFESVEGASDVIVIAGPDHAYTTELIRGTASAHPGAAVGVVAEADPKVETDFRIHRGANRVRTLGSIQRMLGMGDEL